MNANPYANVHQARGAAPGGQIAYRLGQPYRFIATKPFTLGQTGVQVRAGTEIFFDGTKAQVEGSEYTLPYLRGAAKAGWMVLAEEYDENDPAYQRRTSANIQVRHATQGGNPMNPQQRMTIATTESDEREVGNARQHAARTASQNKGYVRGQTPVNALQPGTLVRSQRGIMEVELQDGIEVPNRTLMTPSGERAKHQRLDLTTEDAARALHLAKNVAIQPGEGQTEDEMLAKMDEFQQAEYLSHKEALRAQYVNEPIAQPSAPIVRPSSRQVVARVKPGVRNGQQEGMRFTNSIGAGGVQIGDQSDGEIIGRVHRQDEIAEFEQEGIKFSTTNGPRRPQAHQAPEQLFASAATPPPMPAHLDVRRQIAKTLCLDFPDNYDFNLSPKKKLARVTADYEDRPDVIRAIYAAEGDDFKALLVQEFPHAFQAPPAG